MSEIFNPKRIHEADIARGICILLVVIGHAAPDASASTGISNIFIKTIHDIIYTFHMPLMFFLSGFVQLKSWENDKKSTFIKKRFLRLMVPYFSVGLIYLPFKLILAQYANVQYNILEFWKILGGTNPDGGLWLLYVLFCSQVIIKLIINKKNILGATLVALIISLIFRLVDIPTYGLYINNIFTNFFFVILGLLCRIYYEKLLRYATSKLIFVGSALMFIFVEVLFLMNNSTIIEFLCSLIGIIFIWILSSKIKNGHIYMFFSSLSDYSMDIYIMHGIIMVAIRIVMWSILILNYLVCSVTMFIGGLFISIFASKIIVRKVPIFRFLVLGMNFRENKKVSNSYVKENLPEQIK